MKVKQVDSKGRIVLGSEYAGKLMIVDCDSDPSKIVLIPAIAMPKKDVDLLRNSEALQEILEGLKEAKEGKTAPHSDFPN